MKIKSVAVLGAGAVGSYVIWGLSEKKDIRLGVIASDAKLTIRFITRRYGHRKRHTAWIF